MIRGSLANPRSPGVSQGTSEVVRGGHVVTSWVALQTLLVRGDPGQLRGVARGGSGFNRDGGVVNIGGSQSPSIFKLMGWEAQR